MKYLIEIVFKQKGNVFQFKKDQVLNSMDYNKAIEVSNLFKNWKKKNDFIEIDFINETGEVDIILINTK